MFHQDANDSRDLGDWIVNQEWSDGRIFLMGASADGIESYQTPRSQPDWIKAQYVIWAPAQLYNVLFAGGTYKQKTTEDWIHGLDMPNPGVAETCIQTAHENEVRVPLSLFLSHTHTHAHTYTHSLTNPLFNSPTGAHALLA